MSLSFRGLQQTKQRSRWSSHTGKPHPPQQNVWVWHHPAEVPAMNGSYWFIQFIYFQYIYIFSRINLPIIFLKHTQTIWNCPALVTTIDPWLQEKKQRRGTETNNAWAVTMLSKDCHLSWSQVQQTGCGKQTTLYSTGLEMRFQESWYVSFWLFHKKCSSSNSAKFIANLVNVCKCWTSRLNLTSNIQPQTKPTSALMRCHASNRDCPTDGEIQILHVVALH